MGQVKIKVIEVEGDAGDVLNTLSFILRLPPTTPTDSQLVPPPGEEEPEAEVDKTVPGPQGKSPRGPGTGYYCEECRKGKTSKVHQEHQRRLEEKRQAAESQPADISREITPIPVPVPKDSAHPASPAQGAGGA